MWESYLEWLRAGDFESTNYRKLAWIMLWGRTVKGRSMYRLKNRGNVCLEHPFPPWFSPGRNVSVAGGPVDGDADGCPGGGNGLFLIVNGDPDRPDLRFPVMVSALQDLGEVS